MLPNPHSQHETGFDDSGVVPCEDFNFDAVDRALAPEAPSPNGAERDETAIRILQFLSAGNADAREIGVRVLLLTHIVRPDGTQAQLAARTGLTTARICQRIASIRERLRSGALTFSD